VADFLDIWLARRSWCFRTIAYSSVRYTLFQLTKELRDRDVAGLSEFLREQLDQQPESFAGQPRFRLHQQNYRQVRHILARLTHWVDSQSGVVSHFDDLISEGRAKPFEIEHIWADQYERYVEWFPHPVDFDTERNRIGGLLLLQRGINQSLGDATFEQKRDAYATHGANLLARSLHPLAYQNNPAFLQLIERTGLPFCSYDSFGPEQQRERQELYIRLAESVWNPSRLDLDGEKPPIHEPIGGDEDEAVGTGSNTGECYQARLAFWQQLLAHANTQSDLHARITPSKYGGTSSRRHGIGWYYNVSADHTGVCAYLDSADASRNKALFDALFTRRSAIEDAFGAKLKWLRLDDRKGSLIGLDADINGGWRDTTTWPAAIEQAVDAMGRLYPALAPHLQEILQLP
jgi:hypothetical protein